MYWTIERLIVFSPLFLRFYFLHTRNNNSTNFPFNLESRPNTIHASSWQKKQNLFGSFDCSGGGKPGHHASDIEYRVL